MSFLIAAVACERALRDQASSNGSLDANASAACAKGSERWFVAPHSHLSWTLSSRDAQVSILSEPPLYAREAQGLARFDASRQHYALVPTNGETLALGRTFNIEASGPIAGFEAIPGRSGVVGNGARVCLIVAPIVIESPRDSLRDDPDDVLDPRIEVIGAVRSAALGNSRKVTLHVDAPDGPTVGTATVGGADPRGNARFAVEADFGERSGRVQLFAKLESGEFDVVTIHVAPGIHAASNKAPKCNGPYRTMLNGPSGFINDPTPTFSFRSAPPKDASFECSLNSINGDHIFACTSPYTTPFLVDGKYAFSVYASCGTTIGPTSALAFVVDTIPPDTSILSGPAEGSTITTTSATFAFDSTEPNSTFGCSLDNSALAFSPCTSPWTTPFLSNATHLFAVRATDPAGNTDPTPATRHFTVSPTLPPPDTTITSGPASLTNQATASFTFTSTANPATFECSLDAAGFSSCTSPYSTVPLADGAHSFSVRSIDSTGQVDATPATAQWTVDTTPPDTTITTAPQPLTSSAIVSFTFVSSEASSTFLCSLDGAAFTSCASPYTTSLPDGPHVFSVKAVDAATNVDPTPAASAFVIDTTPPDTLLTSVPTSPTFDLSPTFTFASTEAGSTFLCSMDAGPYVPCVSPFSEPLALGTHAFAVAAVDPAGNVDPTPATWSFSIQNVPPSTLPDTFITISPPNPTNQTLLTFTFISDDLQASFECSVDAVAFSPCASPFTTTPMADGPHTFAVRAVNAAGTDPTPASATVTVDTAPPDSFIDLDRRALVFDAYNVPNTNTPIPQVFAIDHLGSELTQLTFETAGSGMQLPKWSPDGSYLTAVDATYPLTELVVGRGGSVTATLGGDPSLAWSPDSTRLALAAGATIDVVLPDASPSATIPVVDAQGHAIQVSEIAWAPASQIAFVGQLPDYTHEIFVINSDGSGLVQLTHTATSYPVPSDLRWAPDGAHLLFVDGFRDRVVILDTRTPTAAERIVYQGLGIYEPSWSPDSTHIAFTDSSCFGCNNEIFSIAADGSAPAVPLTAIAADNGSPSWSWDGRRIAFMTDRETDFNLGTYVRDVYEMNPDGSNQHRVGPKGIGLAVDWMRRPVTTDAVTDTSTPTFLFFASEPSTFECWIDSAAHAACRSPWTAPATPDGAHVFYVAATDKAGNLDSTPDSLAFEIDSAPPETTITGGPSGPVRVASATFTFVSNQPNGTFECAFDSDVWFPCTSPSSTGTLTENTHVFRVRAIGPAGVVDKTPAEADFGVDLTPPTITLVAPANLAVESANTANVTIGFSEPVTITSSNVFPIAASEPAGNVSTTVALIAGYNIFTINAADAAGNAGSFAFTLFYNSPDVVPPDTMLLSRPPDPTNNPTPVFAFSSNDPHAHFQCELDGGAWIGCVSPWTSTLLNDGAHSFAVRALDVANNPDPTPAAASFTVDTVAPILSLVTPANGTTTASATTSVTISVSEPVIVSDSDVFPSGTQLATGNNTTTVTLNPGYNTFAVFAHDAAGNSTLLTFALFLDNTPPVLSFLSPASGDAIHFSPANVLVSLSEDVTVVDQRVNQIPSLWLTTNGTAHGGDLTATLPLTEGDNVFEATLQDAAGNQTIYSVANNNAFHLSKIVGAPGAPTIAFPIDGTTTSDRTILVSGTAARTPLVPGTDPLQVRVSGASTSTVPIDGSGNWVTSIHLIAGINRVRVVALNAAGVASPEASVLVDATSGATQRVAATSGDSQVTTVGTAAPAPLVATVTDLNGTPIANVPVSFSIAAEPVTADGYIGGVLGQKQVTVSSDASGAASTVVTVATSETNGTPGMLQSTVVVATIPAEYGPPATFRIVGLLGARMDPNVASGAAIQIVPLHDDCTPGASPLGECPLGEAGSQVSGFSALLLDGNGHVVPGPVTGGCSSGVPTNGCVTFSIQNGGASFGVNTQVRVSADTSGIAKSGAVTLPQSFVTPYTAYVMLHPEDIAATKIGTSLVQASADGIIDPVPFVAAAYPGRPAHLLDVSPYTGTAGTVQSPAGDPLVVAVKDRFGNPVANAQVTFSADTSSPLVFDPTDLAKFYRTETAGSDAAPCAYLMANANDACAASEVTATTYSEGTAWSSMILGKHAGAPYPARADVAGQSVSFRRDTDGTQLLGITSPADANYAMEVQGTAAATFAIDDTENDDTDPLTAVVWQIQCDDVAPADGVCDLSAGSPTFHSVRHAGDTVTFSVDQGASFNPPAQVTGQEMSIDGGGRAPVTAPEVAALLHGPPTGDIPLNFSFAAKLPTSTVSVAARGAAALPKIAIKKPLLSLACMGAPAVGPHSFCDPIQFEESLCRQDSAGVPTYIDLTNGYTENDLLVVTVTHPPSSPVVDRTVHKYAHALILSGSDQSLPVDYYNPDASDLSGADGKPGLYAASNGLLPRGPGAGTFVFDYSPSFAGCRELIAKSYVRGAPKKFTVAALPPPKLSFVIEAPSGSLIPVGTVAVRNTAGWVDYIVRSRNVSARRGSDKVPDWFEARAADLWEKPPTLPPGGAAETTEGEDFPLAGGAGVVDPSEPADAYAQVLHIYNVSVDLGTVKNFTSEVDFNANGFPVRGSTDSDWKVSRDIVFNVADPTLRTNCLVPETHEGGITWSTPHEFTGAFIHEARHVWQAQLLTLSGGDFCNDESQTCTGSTPNRNPNNNDDFFFYDRNGLIITQTVNNVVKPIADCLPERAILMLPENGKRDVGGSGANGGVRGSAYGLLDTPDNPERGSGSQYTPSPLNVGGEAPSDPSTADQCELPTQSGEVIRERDAIRFQRAVQEVKQ